MDELKVFITMESHKLPRKQKLVALNVIDLIKEKRYDKIKGRLVADRRKQRDLYSKAEVFSPALSLEGFISTLAIDAAEQRHLVIANVAGAFLKVEMIDLVIVKIQGPVVDALLHVNQKKYETCVFEIKGHKILYVKLLKAMYGMLKALLLWYTLFANTLKDNGFQINPYNNCVANKTVNRSQFTICWYLDDIIYSHKERTVVENLIK